MTKHMLHPDYQFLDQVESWGPFNTGSCFQCRKCSSGCPVNFAMDILPDQVIRRVILGERKEVLNCRTIWVCASCETCTTRCPNDIGIAEMMDCLKEMAVMEGVPAAIPQVRILHETFLRNMNRWGRVFEGGLLPEYMLRSGEIKRKLKDGTWKYDLKLSLQLLAKGRLSILPKRIKGVDEVRKIIARPEKERGRS